LVALAWGSPTQGGASTIMLCPERGAQSRFYRTCAMTFSVLAVGLSESVTQQQAGARESTGELSRESNHQAQLAGPAQAPYNRHLYIFHDA